MPGKRKRSKRANKKIARKRALRTTGPDTKQDSMRAARRKYGEGQGK